MRTRSYRSIVSRLLTIALVALGALGPGIGGEPAFAAGTTPQTITVTSVPSTLNVGQYGTLSATASSGLRVEMSTDDATCSVGLRDVLGDRVGSCVINFDQPGDSTYAPAPRVSATVTILAATNVISPGPNLRIPVGGTGQINATVTSGLPIVYALVTFPGQAPNCSVNSSGLVTGLSIGSCNISLSSSALSGYPAPQVVTLSVQVIGLSQAALTLTVPSRLAPGASGTISISGGSGTGTTNITATGDCTVSGNTVTANSSGSSCTITVTKAGDSTYTSLTTSQTFSIASSSGGGTTPDPSPTPFPASSADSGDIVFALDQEATKKVKPSLDAFDVQSASGGIMIFKGRNLLSVVSVTVGNDIQVKILKSTDAQIDLEMPKAALVGWQTIKLKTSVGEKSFEKAVNYLAAPAKAVMKILKGFKTGQTALTNSQKVALKKFVKAVGKYKIVECRGLTKPSMMTCKYLKTIYKAGRVKVTKLKLKPASSAAKQVRLVFSR